MATTGNWIGTDTHDGGIYYTTLGLNTDVLEFRSGYEAGASTGNCSRPTSIWKNGIFQTRYGCNWPGNVTFTFVADPQKYDCINGVCISSNIYDTPGIYESLEACQSACTSSSECPEGYECVSVESTQQLKDCICS